MNELNLSKRQLFNHINKHLATGNGRFAIVVNSFDFVELLDDLNSHHYVNFSHYYSLVKIKHPFNDTDVVIIDSYRCSTDLIRGMTFSKYMIDVDADTDIIQQIQVSYRP